MRLSWSLLSLCLIIGVITSVINTVMHSSIEVLFRREKNVKSLIALYWTVQKELGIRQLKSSSDGSLHSPLLLSFAIPGATFISDKRWPITLKSYIAMLLR